MTTIPPVPAADLVVGDRLAAGLILGSRPGEILFAHTYDLRNVRWTFLACRITEGLRAGDVESVHFMADKLIQLEARADNGLGYSREPDDPTPVSGGRVGPHFGAMTDGGLVDETPAEPVVHMAFVDGRSACGLPAVGSTQRRQALVWLKVTCQACIGAGGTPAVADTVPVSAEDATLTALPESGDAERAARLQRAKETYA